MLSKHNLAILIIVGLIQLALPSASYAAVGAARRADELNTTYALRSQGSNAREVTGVQIVAALKCLTIYTVRYGETLYSIAAKCGTTAAILMRVNGLRSAQVWPGQRLYIPPPKPKTVPGPQPTPAIHRAPAP
jgi:LysM repeat protein